MNKDKYVTDLAKNKHYLAIYGEQYMNQWLNVISVLKMINLQIRLSGSARQCSSAQKQIWNRSLKQ